METWLKDVEYILMNADHPTKGYEREYNEAYRIWRIAWEKFRAEIGVSENLYSDGFVGANEIGALFYKGQCVGLSCFTYGSLEKGSTLKHHSWFKGWTDIAFQKLKNISSNVMIASQFTVSPEFAGKNQIVRWKEIISLYGIMRFEHSNADVMAGHLNLTRKVNDSCGESFGATILDPMHPFSYYGVDLAAQLVAYERKNTTLMKEKRNVIELCDNLWSQVTCISDYSITPVIPLKKVA